MSKPNLITELVTAFAALGVAWWYVTLAIGNILDALTS